ncbi:nitric oxide synthase oxygenase [Deinococcus sp. Leaf326]|uniref:nitric oxide synthase oxygenase n=1 Tax=Deinococcus sp. Leaf326 TaxID=1736338 RepID=UPI0006F6C8BA|nr:nitric oxide synthase oxygenase [Deinococcus sp. Leaf326]KQR36199.1 nitric oxide synthase [Deinococcus sp. Leaf326]
MTLTPPAVQREAERFLTGMYAEHALEGLEARLRAVGDELSHTGTYTLNTEELRHGGRVAWRNSARCVGRLYWEALEVRDLRHVTAHEEVFAHLCAHLEDAFHGGHLRPLMSVFGPGVRIHNPQLIRYAAYRQPGHPESVVGDPANLALTDWLRRLGWAGGPGTAFDVLPLAIEAGGRTRLFTLPPQAVQEVALTHPDCPAVAELGLRWHALPVISDMSLEVGGLSFACAPFSGWYVQTEIAARNLADADRYDQLPAVGRALGLDTSRERTLWRDRALVELNVATLHSFGAAGVKITDHHTVTRHFRRFEEREARAGREVRGRWSWLIPPLSPATTPVWGRSYRAREEAPNFAHQSPRWLDPEEPASAGACPFHAG